MNRKLKFRTIVPAETFQEEIHFLVHCLIYILRKPKGSSILSLTGLFCISSGMKTHCDITKAVPCGYFTSLMTQLMEHAALSKCMSGTNYMTEQEVLCGRGGNV